MIYKEIVFEDLDSGVPVNIIGYNYQDDDDEPLYLKNITDDRIFYFCDDKTSWRANHLPSGAQRLYELHISLKNPLVLVNQDQYFEFFMVDYTNWIKDKGYDSVISTPHHESCSGWIRQGALFFPKSSIVNLREIPI